MAQRRKKRGKRDAQTKHFTRRLLQRYEIEDLDGFRESALEQISTNKSRFIERQSLRVTVHGVFYEEQEVFVVYDKERCNLVTVLEPDWIHEDNPA